MVSASSISIAYNSKDLTTLQKTVAKMMTLSMYKPPYYTRNGEFHDSRNSLINLTVTKVST